MMDKYSNIFDDQSLVSVFGSMVYTVSAMSLRSNCKINKSNKKNEKILEILK